MFAAAFGPLPGVDPPPRDTSYRSGTAALEMVEAYWSELTTEQRSAIRRYLGDGANAVLPPESSSNVELVSYRSDPDQPAVPLAATYQELADKAAADIAGGIGHPLGIPIRVVASPVEDGDAWAWASGNFNEVPARQSAERLRRLDPAVDRQRPVARSISPLAAAARGLALLRAPPRDLPGRAQGSRSGSPRARRAGLPRRSPAAPERRHPRAATGTCTCRIPRSPCTPGRTTRVGFFAQLAQAAIDPWTVLEPTYKAGAARAATRRSPPRAPPTTFTRSLGLELVSRRLAERGWAMTAGYGIPPVDRPCHAPSRSRSATATTA